MEEEQETTVEIPVVLSEELDAKMHYIANEYSHEVGGWITGEIREDCIYLDDLLIPEQEVSGGSVDIDPSAGPSLLREFKNKCKLIMGHWHSHASMSTFWSNIDETNMSQIMEPRKFFTFIVSSKDEDNHLVRFEAKTPFRVTVDKLKYSVEIPELEELKEKIKKEIENKVTQRTYSSNVQSKTIYENGKFCDNKRTYGENWNINNKPVKVDSPDAAKFVDGDFELEIIDGMLATYEGKNLTINGLDTMFANRLMKDFSEFKPEFINAAGLNNDAVIFRIKRKKARKILERVKELADCYFCDMEGIEDQFNKQIL